MKPGIRRFQKKAIVFVLMCSATLLGGKRVNGFKKKFGFESPQHQVHFPRANLQKNLRRGIISVKS